MTVPFGNLNENFSILRKIIRSLSHAISFFMLFAPGLSRYDGSLLESPSFHLFLFPEEFKSFLAIMGVHLQLSLQKHKTLSYCYHNSDENLFLLSCSWIMTGKMLPYLSTSPFFSGLRVLAKFSTMLNYLKGFLFTISMEHLMIHLLMSGTSLIASSKLLKNGPSYICCICVFLTTWKGSLFLTGWLVTIKEIELADHWAKVSLSMLTQEFIWPLNSHKLKADSPQRVLMSSFRFCFLFLSKFCRERIILWIFSLSSFGSIFWWLKLFTNTSIQNKLRSFWNPPIRRVYAISSFISLSSCMGLFLVSSFGLKSFAMLTCALIGI